MIGAGSERGRGCVVIYGVCVCVCLWFVCWCVSLTERDKLVFMEHLKQAILSLIPSVSHPPTHKSMLTGRRYLVKRGQGRTFSLGGLSIRGALHALPWLASRLCPASAARWPTFYDFHVCQW
jgi:hypothetical protein